jgi:hypothetical protein
MPKPAMFARALDRLQKKHVLQGDDRNIRVLEELTPTTQPCYLFFMNHGADRHKSRSEI